MHPTGQRQLLVVLRQAVTLLSLSEHREFDSLLAHMSKRVYPKMTDTCGEYLHKASETPTKPVAKPHFCVLPPTSDASRGDIWFCYGCQKRYRLSEKDDDNQGWRLDWKRYRGRRNRHKHSRLLDYSRCRCGKYMSHHDSMGPA